MWSWFEGPDNRLRLARFGAAMAGFRNMTPEDAILDGLSHHPTVLLIDHFLIDASNPQGMHGASSLLAPLSSMLGVALARSP